MESFAWAPALVALAAGLMVGAALAWMLRDKRTISAADDAAAATRRDLEMHRDTLLDQLRELDDISAGRDPVLLASERERLELRAARVLARLDEAMPAPAKARKAAAAATPEKDAAQIAADARRAARRGFAWGIGSALAVGGLILWVAGIVKPRGANGQLTGELPSRQGPMAAPAQAEETQPDGELAQLEQAVAQKPDDLDLRLELTQAYLGRRELMKVWEQTQQVLKRSPGNPRAMSYQALVRLAMGQADAAEQQLKEAMKKAPDLLEPRLHLSLVYARTGRVAEANRVIDEAQRRFPTQKEGLERLRNEMLASVAQGGGGAEGQPPPMASAAQATGPHVSGQIDLDPARGAAPAGAIVFLIARAAGQTEGPPVAVKRLPPAFPLHFTLSSEDSMMGQELPAQLRVEARLDSDGNPLTRPASDPSARIDDVRLGDDSLRLHLR